MRATLFALVVNIGFIPSVAAQTSGSLHPANVSLAKKESATEKGPNATQESASKEKRFTFFFKLSNVFDSNIERDVVAVRSYGVVPSLGFNYQNGSSKNPLEINYEAASHTYTNTDKWDRVSHAMSMSYGRRLSRRFRAKTEAEISFKGDSEDRDLDNRYTISQRLEYRPFSTSRLQAFAAYRIKRDPADARNNAISPYFGGKLIQALGRKRSFELGYRYESNRTEDPTGRYIRWKYEGEFTTPFLSRGLLTVGASYRPSLYARTIRVDRARVVRKDQRWDFDATWERPLSENLRLELFYELDTRSSNDVRKIFSAHAAGMSFIYQWQR